MKPEPTVEEVVGVFDDDALLRTMIDQSVESMGRLFEGPGHPPRVLEARDRMRALLKAAPTTIRERDEARRQLRALQRYVVAAELVSAEDVRAILKDAAAQEDDDA